MNFLETLNFDNSFRRLPEDFYTPLEPTPLPHPRLISFNYEAAALLDLDTSSLTSQTLARVGAGHILPPGSEPLAMVYAGHQFGVYNPGLGDGRGLLLGEVVNERGERWDLHLKGAGRTPYSRFGDGRAVLRSSVREYLGSEAMHGLGIATTRALSLVVSDEEVIRERIEPGAAIIRLSQSHLRFGSFEYFYYSGQHELLKTLVDYAIERHYPHVWDAEQPYQAFLIEVIRATARLVAQWQCVGFAHGVLNTDNMSILGETFDYGPYAFMDHYEPRLVSNHSDSAGRYAFDKQPGIGLWNCSCLAQALLPLMEMEEARAALDVYETELMQVFAAQMRAKLGLQREEDCDRELVQDLLNQLAHNQADWTIFFRTLSHYDQSHGSRQALRNLMLDREGFDAWLEQYERRLEREERGFEQRLAAMRRTNPKYVLRNYMVETAIRKAEDEDDFSEVNILLKLLRRPFDEQPEYDCYAGFAPDWARSLQISCSS